MNRQALALIALVVLIACGSQDEYSAETTGTSTRVLVEGRTSDAHAASVFTAPIAGLTSPIDKRTRSGHLFVPEGFWSEDGEYDLLIHFHGAPSTVKRAFQRSRVNAVFFVMNLGNGPEVYEERFRSPEAFSNLISSIQQVVLELGILDEPTLHRIALSSWSAGYGAIRRILAHNEAQDVDSVFMADGPHAPLLNKADRTIDVPSMAPYVRFAQAAARGDRFMSIAYSAVRTSAYASTAETAEFLWLALGLEVAHGEFETPSELALTSIAGRGTFFLRGYEGGDEEAHAEHLKQIDGTLWWELRERWSPVALGE
jgi:hypothetical protein